jgi:hypothetical protein
LMGAIPLAGQGLVDGLEEFLVHNGSAAIAGYLLPNSVATESADKIRIIFIGWKLARGHLIRQIRLFSPPQLFLGLDRICPTLPFTIPA